jgi:hypothetical protein
MKVMVDIATTVPHKLPLSARDAVYRQKRYNKKIRSRMQRLIKEHKNLHYKTCICTVQECYMGIRILFCVWAKQLKRTFYSVKPR